MKEWEKALYVFLKKWENHQDVIGALVCGSFVTGNPSTHSDIDVHIVLSDDADWRKRGNVLINGYLIEYFINPPKQIKKYFEEDYKNLRPHSMVQFLTGKMIFGKGDEIQKLKEEARMWMDKKPPELKDISVELMKYHLWDTLDNLLDCYEQDRPDFDFVFYNSLTVLYREYAKYLRVEITPFYQIFKYFSDPEFTDRYLGKAFTDKYFSDRLLYCLKEPSKANRMKGFEELANHVLDNMGGFTIDGWEMNSAVE